MSSWPVVLLLTTAITALAGPPSPAPSSSVASSPATTVSTAVPSPTLPLNATIPSQAPLPPKQVWCHSDIFCAGQLLQSVDLAQAFPDSKTFVDKPTRGTANQTLADFNAIAVNGVDHITEGQIVQFLTQDFKGEGLELQPLNLPNLVPNPEFLKKVSDPLIKAWAKTVHGFWTQLIRGTNPSALCTNGECESTLIPLNHTFVVPGGRFREQYYWDSYFIVEGLIKSQLFDIANSTLQNFMDEIERFGFVPNGGRIYYLNRSQPPLFIHMLFNYVIASGDMAILERALPLAEGRTLPTLSPSVELKWWVDRRSINVTSPTTQITYTVQRYAVNINSAPRPESYLPDYQTVHGAGGDDVVPNFTPAQQAAIYSELASGAETGWDYSSRWIKNPSLGNKTFTLPALRTLNVRDTVPVDLNSILYDARIRLADLYELPAGKGTKPSPAASSRAAFHRAQAKTLRAAILDLFWDPEKLAFYDFNRTANARGTLYSAANFYALWSGIIPDEVMSGGDEKAFGMFAALNMVLNKYNGTFPVTFHETGLQWDWPNSWPPQTYIILQALRNIPANLTSRALPTPQPGQTTFDLIPKGQIDITSSQLFAQPINVGSNPMGPAMFPVGDDVNMLDGTVVNGGKAVKGESWARTLARELSNRYITSAFCNWHATGGSIPGVLPQLPDSQLNVTLSINGTGHMFEKFSVLNVDAAGRGGEYTVQAGFGWTNGVALWVAGEFGHELVAPNCPPLLP